MALVFWAISSAAASRTAVRVPGGSLPTSPSRWAVSRSIWATCASSAASSVSAAGRSSRPERAEAAGDVGVALGQLGLHLGAAAQAPVDLHVAELLAHRVAPSLADRDAAEDQADPRDDPADDGRDDPERGDLEHVGRDRHDRDEEADDDHHDRDARHRAPGRRLRGDLELDVDLAGQRGPQLAGADVQRAQALDTGADDRQRVGRRMGGRQLVELARSPRRPGGSARSAPAPPRGRRSGAPPGGPSRACSGARRGSARSRPAGRGRRRAGRGPPPAARGPPRPARPRSGPCRRPARPP